MGLIQNTDMMKHVLYSHQGTHLLFKYYFSKLEGGQGSESVLTGLMQGGGVQNQGKLADVILEHSLIIILETWEYMIYMIRIRFNL